MAASNTRECFTETIGRRVVGVLFDALPVGNPSLRSGNKTLVFDDGTGLTFSSNGTFWRESASDVRRAASQRADQLRGVEAELAEVLEVSGLVDELVGAGA